MPHNGFTNPDLLLAKAKELGYSLDNKFEGYKHNSNINSNKSLLNLADTIDVGYTQGFDSRWIYDQGTNTYNRERNGTPEIDKDGDKQVSASVVVIMHTTSTFFRDQYINVATEGRGDITVYQNGIMVSGKWQKDSANLDSKLYFYDNDGKEIEFEPGKIWVEITTNN
jgi:hypothetical protein